MTYFPQAIGNVGSAPVSTDRLIIAVKDSSGNITELPVIVHGAASALNSLLFGGKDTSGNQQPIAIYTNGQLKTTGDNTTDDVKRVVVLSTTPQTPTYELFTALTAVGSTDAKDVSDNIYHTWQVVASGMDVSNFGVIRCEGSNDVLTAAPTNWFNLDDSGSDTTITANGVYKLYKSNFKCNWIRLNFVSETGTASVLTVTYVGGR